MAARDGAFSALTQPQLHSSSYRFPIKACFFFDNDFAETTCSNRGTAYAKRVCAVVSV